MNEVTQFWENRSLKFGARIEGVLLKSVPENINKYLSSWMLEQVEGMIKKESDFKVLDIGCGIGRMAAPLATFLSPEGSYDGTDIVKDGIDWCNEKINSKYPNFRFWLDDIYNSRYNPNGLYKASEYEFPFENTPQNLLSYTHYGYSNNKQSEKRTRDFGGSLL